MTQLTNRSFIVKESILLAKDCFMWPGGRYLDKNGKPIDVTKTKEDLLVLLKSFTDISYSEGPDMKEGDITTTWQAMAGKDKWCWYSLPIAEIKASLASKKERAIIGKGLPPENPNARKVRHGI